MSPAPGGRIPVPALAPDTRRALLAGQAMHVWLLDARRLGPAQRDMAESLLPAGELRNLAALQIRAARDEAMMSRLGLRLLLTAYCGPDPAWSPGDWQFTVEGSGRPVLARPDGAPAFAFSLSHSHGTVAVALAVDAEPGIDVETGQRELDAGALARRFFAAGEAAGIDALPESRRRAVFLRHWTLKEASVKADGQGLVGGQLRRRHFAITDSVVHAGYDDGRSWQYWSFDLPRGAVMAAALRHPADGEQGGAPAERSCQVRELQPFSGRVSSPSVSLCASSTVDAV